MTTLPPVGVDGGEIDRIDEMRFRRRLLDSMHRQDAKDATIARFGLDRSADIAEQSIAWWMNIYPGIWNASAWLYVDTPGIKGPDNTPMTRAALRRHFAAGRPLQRATLALREVFKVVERVGDDAVFHTVYPDYFDRVECLRTDPSALGRIRVWIDVGGGVWETREWSLNDGPTFARGRWEGKAEPEIVQTLTGPEYPYRDAAGPLIPGVMYHAELTGQVLNWEVGSDVAFGCVALTVDFTSAEHALTEAAWRQRWIANLEPASGVDIDHAQAMEGEQRPPRVVKADPRSILELHTPQGAEGKPPMVGTFEAPTDPEALLRYNIAIAQRLMASAGLQNVDVLKNSADIRSGISLTVSREQQAELQRTHKAPFGAADAELAHKIAVLLGEPSPGPGAWTVSYRPIRLSAAELRVRVDAVAAAQAAGLMTREEAILTVHPELTEDEAAEMQLQLDAEVTIRAAAAVVSAAKVQPKDEDAP